MPQNLTAKTFDIKKGILMKLMFVQEIPSGALSRGKLPARSVEGKYNFNVLPALPD